MALLSMSLVACNQDFDTEFVPQTNLPESLLKASDVSVAATSATTINLADYIDEETGINKDIAIISSITIVIGKWRHPTAVRFPMVLITTLMPSVRSTV